MTHPKIKALTIALLVTLVLAFCCPLTSVAADPEWAAQPMYYVVSPAAAVWSAGYSPDEIRAAYNLPSTGGTGTIAIIDAFDHPYVLQDLRTFSLQFELPSPNLEVHKMSTIIWPDASWALEIALDVQWAHAIAPNAKILLVEARSNYLSDLLAAVNYARNRPDVVSISMSWGGNEFPTETYYDGYFTSAYGASFFAASGDTGGAVIWPSSSANVVSVGGTTLTPTTGGYRETAWSGSGGGASAYVPQPGYQAGLGYSKRATPDVSYNADPSTGFAVYDSYGYSGWVVVGGTSAGAPQWAAIQSLGHTASNNNFYATYKSTAYGTDFRDITSGRSGGYTAKIGYDLTTGIGSPLTTDFAASPGPTPTPSPTPTPTPTPAPDFSITAYPSPVSINMAATNKGTSTVTVTAISGFTGTVALSATAPAGWTATLSPAAVTGSGTSTLTITVPAGTAGGTYPVTVKGTSGSITHSITVNVQVLVTKPDFALTVSPTSLTITPGGTRQATAKVTPLNGYTGTVALSASPPAGFSITFSPPSLKSGDSTMTIAAFFYILPKTYPITITAKDAAGLTHSATITVAVTTW